MGINSSILNDIYGIYLEKKNVVFGRVISERATEEKHAIGVC